MDPEDVRSDAHRPCAVCVRLSLVSLSSTGQLHGDLPQDRGTAARPRARPGKPVTAVSSLNCHQAKPNPTSRLSNPQPLVVGLETCPDRTTVGLALRPLQQFQYELKGISFLPRMELGAYAQMPYEEITQEEYKEVSGLSEVGRGDGVAT